jgi:ABC-type sulfate/molybdate transport systems ATPase subunit
VRRGTWEDARRGGRGRRRRDRAGVGVAAAAVARGPAAVTVDGAPKAREAAELIDFLGLGRYADDFIANLSTGTRRIVELACLFAVDARVLLLDEPTAGVAQETEAFGPLLLRVQQELDAAMVVIEHDMPLIMGIASRVYCLEAGRVIADGPPAAVRNDPRVIASYPGTDERAVARSGASAGTEERSYFGLVITWSPALQRSPSQANVMVCRTVMSVIGPCSLTEAITSWPPGLAAVAEPGEPSARS